MQGPGSCTGELFLRHAHCLDITHCCAVCTSHIDWHLELYVIVPSLSVILLPDFAIDRGLAVVLAEDIPDIANENPVTGMCIRGR